MLPDFSIGGYDYKHFNADDAFGGIAQKMAEAGKIVFATPVYWYAIERADEGRSSIASPT